MTALHTRTLAHVCLGPVPTAEERYEARRYLEEAGYGFTRRQIEEMHEDMQLDRELGK